MFVDIRKNFKIQILIILIIQIFSISPLKLRSHNLPSLLTSRVRLKLMAHIQGKGDVKTYNSFIGTAGNYLRLQGFSITIDQWLIFKRDVHLTYMARFANGTQTGYVKQGQFVGTRGQYQKLQGFAIKLVGSDSESYQIEYRAHIQGAGDTPFYKNGEYCGTKGENRRLQAMQVYMWRKIFS